MAWMRRLLTITAMAWALAACDPGGVGDPCQAGALEEDCVEGAICTPEADDRTAPPADPNDFSYVCRTICEVQADCEPGFSCLRVEGSMLSSCQPTGEETGADAGTP